MSAPSVLSQIDQASLGTPMTAPTDPDMSLGYSESDRQTHMALALRAYKGRLPKPLKVDPKEPDLNLRTNRCRPIVDTGVAFLVGKPPQFAVEQAGGPDAQDALDETWEANKKALLLGKAATNGGIFGDVYLKVVPEGIMHNGKPYPRIVNLDPQRVTVETDPDDCELAVAYNICWEGVDKAGKPVQRRQRIYRADANAGGDVDDGGTTPVGGDEPWVIQNQVRTGTGSDGNAKWVDDAPAIQWEYGWPPIHHCANMPEPNAYYGAPDLTPDLIELQKALNFALSDRHKIMFHFAHPIPWAKGARPEEIRNAVGQMTVFASENASMQNMEINGAGVAALDNHIEDIRSDMDELSGVPAVAVGRLKDLPKGAVPGVTVRLWFQPMITRTEKKQATYGDMLASLNSHILEMQLGKGTVFAVQNHWQDVLPVNMAEWSTYAPVLASMGVSEYKLLAMVDIDRDEEIERKQQEDADKADLAQQAMSNFDAGKTPGAAGLADVHAALDAQNANGATGPTPPPPAVSAAALNHPAMQAQRAAAIATAAQP